MLELGKRLRTAIGIGAIGAYGFAFAATLTVTVDNVDDAEGSVRIVVYDEQTWLSREQWIAREIVPAPDAGSLSVTFDLPSGSYAVAVVHDVNGNGRMDTRMRFPKEPYGFSNGVVPRFGPPKFQDARFDIGEDDLDIAIELRD